MKTKKGPCLCDEIGVCAQNNDTKFRFSKLMQLGGLVSSPLGVEGEESSLWLLVIPRFWFFDIWNGDRHDSQLHHKKEVCSDDEIGRCAQSKDIILGLVDDTIEKAYVTTIWKRKKNLYFDLFNSKFDT
jgi:hypothetical protein